MIRLNKDQQHKISWRLCFFHDRFMVMAILLIMVVGEHVNIENIS